MVPGGTSPENIQAISRDPEIMEAAKAGDFEAMMENPKFKELLSNPDLQKAVKKFSK